MEELDNHITINEKTIKHKNLTEYFSDSDLSKIGSIVKERYDRDVESRADWTLRTSAAMDLAMQMLRNKAFPWPNCSNVAFPLVTIAALQFHARAYPAIINGRSVVQCRTVGEDKEGKVKARAERISTHMSWQLLEQDEPWEEQTDRALISVPIVGCAFKKSYFHPDKAHNVSETVLARDLVLDYYAKSVDDCPTKTHIIPMFRNEMHSRMKEGTFVDVSDAPWYQAPAPVTPTDQTEASDHRTGKRAPNATMDTPFTLLEQHCNFDLDGDGYEEPYIVTIEESTETVLRIVSRCERIEDVVFNSKNEIVKMIPLEYFTKIPFIPSPDGSVMDVGFGVLLGPLNESVNTAINQIFDAGTISNTAGGFLGRGAKIRGGVYNFSPFGWQRIDSVGDDLRKNIVPLPVREPSSVLFNLLGLMIDYTNRISGATDMLTGVNPGQNTPAETSRAMVEQGQKIYSAIFKRVWRSMKAEFKKLYILNSIYLPPRVTYGEAGAFALREDYLDDPSTVVPVADPNISSSGERYAQAQILVERASLNPGYNADAVERNLLKSLSVDSMDSIYPGQEKMPEPAPDVKLQIAKGKLAENMARMELDKMKFIMTLHNTVKLNNAKIIQLMAQANKLQAEAKGADVSDKISAFTAAIDALSANSSAVDNHILEMMKGMNDGSGQDNPGAGVVQQLAGASGDQGSPQMVEGQAPPTDGVVG